MTLILESPTPTVAARPIHRSAADFEAPTSWARAAVRAHAVLSQTMPDEELDELVAAAVPFDQAIVLPPFFFG